PAYACFIAGSSFAHGFHASHLWKSFTCAKTAGAGAAMVAVRATRYSDGRMATTPTNPSTITASVTVGAPRENLTRAPFELGWIPSPASRTPAFTISSLNRPIAATSSLLGRRPDSVFLSARTSIMNRIVSPYRVSLWSLLGWPAGALTGATSRAPTLPRRALPHGPDFDGARTGQRNACGDGDGFVEILDVDEHVAAELLAGLRERPVGHEPLAVAHPDAGRRGRRVQRRAVQMLAARLELVPELHGIQVDLLALGHAEPVPDLLVPADQEHVFHVSLHH